MFLTHTRSLPTAAQPPRSPLHLYALVWMFALFACASGGWFTQTSAAFEHITEQATQAIERGEIDGDVQAYFVAIDCAERRLLRDRVATRILMVIDGEYQVFRQLNASVRAHISAGLDMSALGLGAAATLAPHEATAKLLAGLATVATGSRGAVDQNFFFESTMPALIAQMDSLRALRRHRILTMLAKCDAEFSLTWVLTEVYEYYLDGTIPRALSVIEASAKVSRDKAEQKMDDIVEATEPRATWWTGLFGR